MHCTANYWGTLGNRIVHDTIAVVYELDQFYYKAICRTNPLI